MSATAWADAGADPFLTALQDRAPGAFSYCSGRILSAVPADAEALAGEALLDPACLDRLVARFGRAYEGADRRAIVSMWSLYYFSALAIPSAIGALVLRRRLPLALAETIVVFDAEKGTPTGFVVGVGESGGRQDIHARMRPALIEHAGPLIAAMSRHMGLSSRLLWNNLAPYLAWAVEEAGRAVDGRLAAEGRALLEDERLPDGLDNPLAGKIRRTDTHGLEHARRRLCCLRYLLPGVEGCGLLCPVPEGRLAREAQKR